MAARCRGGGGGKGAPIGGPSTRSSTRVCGRETAIGPHTRRDPNGGFAFVTAGSDRVPAPEATMKLLTFSRVRFAIFIVVLHKLRLLRAACAMLACTLIMLVVRQRATLYVPTPMGASRSNARNPANQRTPAEYDLPFEELSVQTTDGFKLHGWLIYQASEDGQASRSPVLVYLHANAGNIGTRLPLFAALHACCGVHVLAIDYRG